MSKKKNHFFAMLSRMKYINRWALMRNAHEENLSEHSLDVAMTAHALVLMHNEGSDTQLNAERAAVLAMFHDAPEILTGDLPTPVKYYNAQTKEAYRVVEDSACQTILDLLPDDLRKYYEPMFIHEKEDAPLWRFVKAADKICALTKCIAERQAGNLEFEMAAQSTMESIHKMNMPEAEAFLESFLPGYKKTLDELKG